jgi:CRISPR-associated endonuclease/helicase Cas3
MDVESRQGGTFADEAAAWGLAGKLVLLPPAAGGLTTTGMLDGAVPYAEGVAYDVADTPARCRVFDLAKAPDKWRLVRRVTVPAAGGDEDAPARCWYWFVAPPAVKVKAGKGQKYADHVAAVFDAAAASAAALFGPALADVGAAVKEAARWHDTGKLRDEFQLVTLGNAAYNSAVLGTWAAKSDRGKGRTDGTYRHEFGSVLDAAAAGPAGCPHLSAAAYELALHLVAAHHGWARPHFPAAKAFDLAPGREQAARAQAEETPARFARLQRAYGRWGLAYIESVLRAADWAASAAS